MKPLDLLIYEAKIEIHDDRYPVEVQPISETTTAAFEPIPDQTSAWADGHCNSFTRGGQEPSYRVLIPAGELWDKVFDSGIVRTYCRTPATKAADGIDIVCMARYRCQGFRFLPCPGGKPIRYEVNPLSAATAPLADPEPVPVEATAPVPPPARIMVEFGPAPPGPPPKRTQLNLFDFEASR